MSITRQDVSQLVQEPSPAVRARIVGKIANSYNSHTFTERENALAIEIFRLLLKDTAASVRKAMAQELKNNAQAPHDVIVALAHDELDIAVEVLEFSEVLNDEDLLELVRVSRDMDRLLAISRRAFVSTRVSASLIDTNHQQVIRSLLNNKGANLAELDIQRIISQYRGDQSLLEALVCRGGLSPRFAEKLYYLVSDQLKQQLTRRYRLSWRLIGESSDVVRESAILKFMAPWMSRKDVEKLVDQMYRNKRLNYSIALRSLCVGEVEFFEFAIARLANVTVENVRVLLADHGPLGFKSLFDAANIPSGFSDAVRILYAMAKEEVNKGNRDTINFQRHMIDRITVEGYHHSIENMGYFISMMRQQGHGHLQLH